MIGVQLWNERGKPALDSPWPPDATVSPRDVWLLLLSQVRYALGRSTYIVGCTYDAYHRYKGSLRRAQRLQIAQEIEAQLHLDESHGRTTGMKCDHDVWKRLVADIRREEGVA